ncbi:MAG: hypothetical protein WBB19_02105 [Desulforhopalus sp.]
MIVTYDDLKKITGYTNTAAVVSCLIKQNIKFLTGFHGRPYTTLGALELAMGATLIHKKIEEEAKPRKPKYTA